MKFKSATIKDFRRFTNLVVSDIPETARLIILAGPNGCGKSSFFDALCLWHQSEAWGSFRWDPDYYIKGGSQIARERRMDDVEVKFHEDCGPDEQERRKILYVRSAYRNDPEFQINQLQRLGNPLDQESSPRMIDNDASVAKNFQRLASQALEDVFDPKDGKVTLEKFKEQVIGDISTAFSKLFPDIELNSLGNPLEDGTFRFTKGTSKGFSFKNLSGGEKAAFDLILDLVVAKRTYDNTIFCIDEPESHMNARLQAELLSVLYELIPENCQLMLATHSIGMMRRARDIAVGNPESVVFLDFEDLDFDLPQVIEPTIPDRTFWKKAYNVALDDLAALVAPERVVICEGEPMASQPVRNHSHDAKCYDRIFEDEFPETRFVSMGNDREIVGDKRGLVEALLSIVDDLKVLRLIDRDDRTDEEIADANRQGVRVLSRRNLESYLFDDEVLRALAVSVGKDGEIEKLLSEKQRIVANKTSGPPDNLKLVSGEIYNACKNILDLKQCGNAAKAFMRATLAPLIKPGMGVYDELKRDIFGPRENS